MRRWAYPVWWLLDYAYAGWVQILSVFRRRAPGWYSVGDAHRPAVVVLPGVYESWLFLNPVAKRLSANGYRIFTVPELGINQGSVPDAATHLRQRLAELRDTHGVISCVLLAHSKGGLIGKAVMLDVLLPPDAANLSGQMPEILGMAAINTPFAGSVYAKYLFPRVLRQFSPADAVLLSLQAQQGVNQRIISIYPVFDPHIPGGSELFGAKNVQVAAAGHFRTLKDPLVLNAVDNAVAELAAGR